jgi:cytochrome c1
MMRARFLTGWISLCIATAWIAGCKDGLSMTTGGGSPAVRGRATIASYGCGKCHTIPGIRNANGVVGPPLGSVGQRAYIAGNFPNTPANLARWVMSPQAMKPKTAMPSLGLTHAQAEDVAAYLDTLR